MNNINIGYDDNLGIPKDFAEIVGCNVLAYHDLGKMINAYNEKKLVGMFIPSGTLPYIKKYSIIAQALFSDQKKRTLQTNFVSTKNISISEISTLTIGRVNQYCTTSFWAPLIYLMKFFPKNTVLTFENTDGFVDMLHKTAIGQIDCSAVWDVIMQENLSDANSVRQLFHINDLPTPVIVAGVEFPADMTKKIIQFNTEDKKAFFSGFCMPDQNAIHHFISAMDRASEYFNITSKSQEAVD